MKIAILTNLMEFNPGYSLTGIIRDQAAMLYCYGHDVRLFVNEQYHGSEDGIDAELAKIMPFTHLIDYQTQRDLTDEHKTIAETTGSILAKELRTADIVFTHDFALQGWFLPYLLGCVMASKELPGLPWMHWVHSIPSRMRDWWLIRKFGPRHTLIYPNNADLLLVAEQYRGALENCRCIHHIKDPRVWFDMSEETCDVIDRMPGLMQADIVQILPASVDRLSAKRVNEVIKIFSWFKKYGRSVAIIIANQWATTRTHKESVETYMEYAGEQGLMPGEEILFTSMLGEQYEAGISQRMIRELFALSNLFIFPTREETFGLVMPEAALSGAYMVINSSLDMAREVVGQGAFGTEFGSHRRGFSPIDMDDYLRQVAVIILGRMAQNEAIITRTHARQHYNMDYLYKQEYAPVMAEIMSRAL